MIGLVMAGGRGTRMRQAGNNNDSNIGGNNDDGPGEKLLLTHGGRPVVMRVAGSLRDSGVISRVAAATSHANSPRTAALLSGSGIQTIETPGDGYVQDLGCALRAVASPSAVAATTASVTPPAPEAVLVASGDMALLDGQAVRMIAAAHRPQAAWTTILVTDSFLESAGLGHRTGDGPAAGPRVVSPDGLPCRYTGASVVNPAAVLPADDGRHVKESRVIIDDVRIAFNINTRRDYEFLLDTA